jgi:hypothetical protein
MDAHFGYPAADRLAIAKVAKAGTVDPRLNAGADLTVFQAFEPLGKIIRLADFNPLNNVSYRRHCVNVRFQTAATTRPR